MSRCPLNKPCSSPKTITLLMMHGKEEETIKVCVKCPLARQVNIASEAENRCAVCESSLNDIISGKLLGCEFCYLFMEEKLTKVIKKVQDGSTKHIGKKPKDKTVLLQKLFLQALEKYQEKNPKDAKSCAKLKRLLTRYF